MPKFRTCYRIVEVRGDGGYYSLFHGRPGHQDRGQQRTRQLPQGVWLRAENKPVDDGGTEYISGFHVTFTEEACRNYLRRFKPSRELRVIRIQARGLRPKAHSRDPIYLADQIFIPLLER